jgi:hypothetical protein
MTARATDLAAPRRPKFFIFNRLARHIRSKNGVTYAGTHVCIARRPGSRGWPDQVRP